MIVVQQNNPSLNFLDALDDCSQTVKYRVTATWADSKFMDNLVTTATGDGTTSSTVPCANDTFTKDQAGNGKELPSFRWAVVDAKAVDGSVIKTDSKYRVVNAGEPYFETYERGWWSKSLSDGSGVCSQSIYHEFDQRKATSIRITTAQHYGRIKNYTLYYKNTSNVWTSVGSFTMTSSSYQAEHTLGGTLDIKGVRIDVTSTWNASDVVRIHEVAAIYEEDISDDIISVNIEKIRENFDTTVPFGITGANSADLVFDNTSKTYNRFGSSGRAPYLNKDVKLKIESGWLVAPNTYEYVTHGFYYTDEWTMETSGMTTSVKARDFSKFLQDGGSLEFGYLLINVYASEAIEMLALMGGVPEDYLNIVSTGSQFPYFFDKGISIWDAMLNVATADMGMFYFDDYGLFTYETKDYFLTGTTHTTSQFSFSDTTNIADADYVNELQVNKVVVSINKMSYDANTIQSLWRANNGESLVTSTLAAGVGTSDTTFFFVTDSPLWKDSGLFKIDNEIMSYSGRTSGSVTGVQRGLFGTTAATHSGGALVREVREYNIELSNAPAIYVKEPFIWAEKQDQTVDIEAFVKTAYTVYVRVSANTSNTSGDTIMLEGTHPITGKDYYFAIAGIPFTTPSTDSTSKAVAKDDVSIRRYGIKDLTIENPFIGSETLAQAMCDWILSYYKTPVPLINLDTLGIPHLALGWRVRVTNLPQFDIINQDYYIMQISLDYDGGVKGKFVLRRV